MSQTFRNDINGLRAIAVIAVVLFHFNPSWVPGGFAGVDVFFVISGFLMTGIIFKGLDQNNFSILKFYVARANRIIPALALLCLVLLVFGWFYLTPLEYRSLGKHVASSMGFISNFIYWTETGYFDTAAHKKWLLHTWSLSAEWQFYIIYPIVLVLLKKLFSIKTIKSILLIGTILGFIFCAIATYKWPNASYYLLHTRAWEMMLGGIAYLYPFTLQENRKKLFEWTGLLLIVGSYFLISAENPWPGYLAILPVLGTFLIIQAHRNNSFITNNLVFQKIGAWSYSIYLWHWPLVVAILTFKLPEYYTYLGITLSVLLGFLSYKYIEKIKFRNNFPDLLTYLKSKPLYMVAGLGVVGAAIFMNTYAITLYRFQSDVRPILEQQDKLPPMPPCSEVKEGKSSGCTYGDGPVKAIVIGDSHARAQNIAIGNRAKIAGGSILSWSLSGCPTVKDIYLVDENGLNPNFDCGKMVSSVINIASKQYPNIPVIIISRISSHIHGANEFEGFQQKHPRHFVDREFNKINDSYRMNITSNMINTICEFNTNNPTYLVRPTPEMREYVPDQMFQSLIKRDQINKDQRLTMISRAEYNSRHSMSFSMQDEAVKKCGVKILDPIPYFCDEEYCYGDINGTPPYYDDDHLSSYGAELISPIYDEVFK